MHRGDGAGDVARTKCVSNRQKKHNRVGRGGGGTVGVSLRHLYAQWREWTLFAAYCMSASVCVSTWSVALMKHVFPRLTSPRGAPSLRRLKRAHSALRVTSYREKSGRSYSLALAAAVAAASALAADDTCNECINV